MMYYMNKKRNIKDAVYHVLRGTPSIDRIDYPVWEMVRTSVRAPVGRICELQLHVQIFNKIQTELK